MSTKAEEAIKRLREMGCRAHWVCEAVRPVTGTRCKLPRDHAGLHQGDVVTTVSWPTPEATR